MSNIVCLYQEQVFDYFFKGMSSESNKNSTFTGSLGNYKVVMTEDNSFSFWSEHFGQLCHSHNGAEKETIHNFINYLNYSESQKHLNILEIGFGTGKGLLCFLDWYINQIKYDESILKKNIKFHSIEIDSHLVKMFFKVFSEDTFLKKIPLKIQYRFDHTSSAHILSTNHLEIKIFNVNALDFVKNNTNNIYQNFFHDAFSPDVNPCLWTEEFFQKLYNISDKSKCTLSTYSSASIVRNNLLKAGWNVFDAKGFANKRTMTIATTHKLYSEEVPS